MREEGGLRFYAATDLVNYLGCAHATACDLRQLASPVELSGDDEHAALLQEKGLEHERAYLERLRKEGRSVVEIPSDIALGARVTATRSAMQSGADVVYQGALVAAPWHGFSDFLLRVSGVPSSLGNFAYDVADTKLARTAKPKHIVQLCVYADLLGAIQGIEPPRLHVVLGDGTQVSLPTSTVRHYYGVARTRFETFVAAPAVTTAEPCGHCEFCRWKETCEAEWEANGHLSLVANINRVQIDKLRDGGIATLQQLAALGDGSRIPNLQPDTLARLRAQARLQVARLDTGQNQHEMLPSLPGRGFARFPQPDPSDLFFDMEGDPLYEQGLEYLFGFIHDDAGQERFTAYWAHNRADEKKAFECAVDFITARLAAHPDAHIYHYASYEESALKRLAMLHGTREVEVDNLLRRHKLVDLYKVVREAVRISEPRYSIKNVEAFYLDVARSGEVKTAGESIIIYERFRRLGNVEFLKQIEDYNKFDCQSLRLCRDWLVSLRPAGLAWPNNIAPEKSDPAREQKRTEAEQRTAAHIRALTAGCPSGERQWRELLAYLLEFHRREAKPKYWAMFSRQEMSDEELVDDPECVGFLAADPSRPPQTEKRSMIYSFTFPPQDFKMRVGEEVLRAGTLEPAGEIFSLEEDARRISVKLGPKWSRIADGASLIPKGPLGDEVLRAGIYRYAEAAIAGNATRYTALTDIMRKAPPRLTGQPAGAPIIPSGADLLQGSVAALKRLDGSYMLIQGPPGAGKTYTSSHAIVALLKDGKRIGVASNSHKAINNLLKDVEAVAREQKVHFRGIKKSSNEEQYCRGSVISDTLDNDEATGGGHQLIAGTAWLFARQELDQALDYLFIDEAGQVSLANVIAMGVSAKNIVLVGDQMQLAQTTSAPLVQLVWQLFKAAELEGIEITAEGAIPNPTRFGRPNGKKSRLKSVNRGKLLLSYFRDVPPRQLRMFLMMTKGAASATSINSSSSQSEHRAAFFRAVALGDEHMAFKMVGRLREEEHDPGELVFLEALASFHSNRFDEAVRYAREVPKDAIDWPRAFMLVLESHAHRGDIEALSAEIRATPESVFPQFFIPYVCLIAVENSSHPEEALERAVELIKEATGRSQPGMGAFNMWNRRSCQLAVQFVEQQQEIALRELAMEQGGRMDAKEEDDVPLRVRQVACALVIDADLASKLSEVGLDDAYQEVVKRLVNHSQPERLDYLHALIAQWRIGDHLVFLKNVAANLDVLVADSTPEAWQLIVWAYQEAQIQKRPADIELFRRRLVESPTMARKLIEVETVVGTDLLERQLSPMGRLALRSANWDLLRAEEDSRLWRDAGMISLGFFRILELEFNERLVLPTMRVFDLDAFEKQFRDMKVGELQGSMKKAVDFWEKMIGPLGRAKHGAKGLELGTIEKLLQKVAQVGGVDSELKARLHSGLSVHLSTIGIDALKSGQLARLVDESARERFRNPPAHSRYVDLATARDCKRYVDAALNQLIGYTSDEASRNSTIH